MRTYDVILCFVFSDQREVHVRWDMELYFKLRKQEDFVEFLFNKEKTGLHATPVSVESSIYLNPEIKSVITPYGRESIVIGTKIHVLDFF
jgi:hypothetical protein